MEKRISQKIQNLMLLFGGCKKFIFFTSIAITLQFVHGMFLK